MTRLTAICLGMWTGHGIAWVDDLYGLGFASTLAALAPF